MINETPHAPGASSGASHAPRRGRSLKARIAMTAVASAVAIPLVAGVGTVAMADHKLSNVARAQLLGTQHMETPATAGKAVNMLLVGTDARSRSVRGHSDLMVLVHISSDRKRVDLIHFPSELRGTTPGKSSIQLKQAYAKGGAPLLVDTIQPMIGVPVNHVGVINFQGFEQMVDAVGGIDVNGQHMNGAEALQYMRERTSASVAADVHRGDRQMDLIRAVFAKAASADVLTSPTKLNNWINAATSNTTVDSGFSNAEMRDLMLSLNGLQSSNIVQHTAPFVGATGLNAKQAPQQMAELRTALQNDAMASYVDTASPVKGQGR